MEQKNEIMNMLNNYKMTVDSSICNEELKQVLDNIGNHVPREKPDAFLCQNNIIYGIEHFQVSQYAVVKKNQDISKISKGSKDRRDRMKEDRDFDFKPSIDNLVDALSRSLRNHSKSFDSYKENILKLPESINKEYKLIIFVEDSTESGYIVKKRGVQPINPLLLEKIANVFLEYKNDIWGIIYAYGNEVEKRSVACTLDELDLKMQKGDLLDTKDYVPFEVGRKVHISKDNQTEDLNTVTICLCDHM